MHLLFAYYDCLRSRECPKELLNEVEVILDEANNIISPAVTRGQRV